MTVEQLRNVHQAQPFRPFALHLADGREMRVLHPEYLSHSPTGRTVVVHESDDRFNVIDLLLVTRLEVLAPSSGGPESGNNGSDG